MFIWNPHDLDPDQQAAIEEDGNVFLISCPGSGKTRTLTYKIADELSKLNSDKKRVIAFTYTNRAADEIHERVEALGVDSSQLWIGTIHSFCLEWIIKPYSIYHESLKHGFRVINTHDTEDIINSLCDGLSPRITFWNCGFYFRKDGYVITESNQRFHENIHKVLDGYFDHLEKNRQIDFELILFYAYEIIAANPMISKILGNIFSIMLIDEYQDTKDIQYSIITSILRASGGDTKAFVVGDPNQSIFSNLGGFPISIKDFEAQTGLHMKPLVLTRNYRSSERIVKYFAHFNVFATEITSVSKHKDFLSKITYDKSVHLSDLEEELVKAIQFNIEVEKIPPHEICILAPRWVSLASMTRRLITRLPQYEFDGPGMLPFASNTENFFYKLSKIALTRPAPDMFLRRCRWAREIIEELVHCGALSSAITAKQLLRTSNLLKIDKVDGLEYLESYFANIFNKLGVEYTLFPSLKDDYNAFFAGSRTRIKRLKDEGAESVASIDNFFKVFASRGGITISTIHGIKGDEYEAVIAYALLDGMLPHFSDTEQEKSAMKLLYVICSRAKKNLHLISERGRSRGRFDTHTATPKLAGYLYSYDVGIY